jgi:hypothetical protein
MFGGTRTKTVKLVPFAEANPEIFTELLCDGVSAYGLTSFVELMAVHARLQAEHPNYRVLASLDDLVQAAYTSGHGTNFYELDNTEGHDLSRLGPKAFDGNEHIGHLSTPAEFPIRLANLLNLARAGGLEQVAGVLLWETAGDANDLISVNSDPEQALRIAGEKDVIFQFVPVDSAADAIAAFPNGYFTCDLSPMQNHVLARHLELKYGLALFGIGASYLGFRRIVPLGENEAQALSAELAAIYAETPQGAAVRLARLITGREWLLLRYTES